MSTWRLLSTAKWLRDGCCLPLNDWRLLSTAKWLRDGCYLPLNEYATVVNWSVCAWRLLSTAQWVRGGCCLLLSTWVRDGCLLLIEYVTVVVYCSVSTWQLLPSAQWVRDYCYRLLCLNIWRFLSTAKSPDSVYINQQRRTEVGIWTHVQNWGKPAHDSSVFRLGQTSSRKICARREHQSNTETQSYNYV